MKHPCKWGFQTTGKVVLSWPATSAAFTLQSTTNLAAPLWEADLSAPVTVEGVNTVTDKVTGAQRFYRLTQ